MRKLGSGSWDSKRLSGTGRRLVGEARSGLMVFHSVTNDWVKYGVNGQYWHATEWFQTYVYKLTKTLIILMHFSFISFGHHTRVYHTETEGTQCTSFQLNVDSFCTNSTQRICRAKHSEDVSRAETLLLYTNKNNEDFFQLKVCLHRNRIFAVVLFTMHLFQELRV